MKISTKVGAIFVIFSIVISFMMWKEDQIPYKNYGFINGVITNIERSNFDDNVKITVDYVIDNTTYTIKQSTGLGGLYANGLITLVYNRDNCGQAEIKYASPGFVYAAMFILFLAGMFFLLFPIWTGSMKWEKIRSLRNGAVFEITEETDTEINGNNNTEEHISIISKIIKPKNPVSAVLFMMSLIFIAFALLFIAVAHKDSKSTIKNPVATNGVIVDVDKEYLRSSSDSTGNYLYRPIVKFTVQGKEYVFTNRQNFNIVKINDKVTVIYNKSYPYQAEIKPEKPLAIYGFGSVFLLAGAFLFVTSRRLAKDI